MMLSPLQSNFGHIVGKSYYLNLSGVLGFPLVILWFITALYLGFTYNKSIAEERTVC